MKRWWLSFASDENVFLGVCLVDADHFIEACRVAKTVGCNPGGQAMGVELPPLPEAQAEWALPTNRLLSQADLEAALGKERVKPIREWDRELERAVAAAGDTP